MTIETVQWQRTLSAVDVALFSAATWNPHLIHLSEPHALADGLAGAIVQSHFLPALVLAMLDDRDASADPVLKELSWRNISPVHVGSEVDLTVHPDPVVAGKLSWLAAVAGQLVAQGSLTLGRSVRQT